MPSWNDVEALKSAQLRLHPDLPYSPTITDQEEALANIAKAVYYLTRIVLDLDEEHTADAETLQNVVNHDVWRDWEWVANTVEEMASDLTELKKIKKGPKGDKGDKGDHGDRGPVGNSGPLAVEQAERLLDLEERIQELAEALDELEGD